MNNRLNKKIAIFLSLIILVDVATPTVAFALTGGPSQPEVQGFTPIGTSDMVSPFSGDFSYNIPLMDIGGYPINISYSSGIGMDQEASWVGLGWGLNPGVINRSMRAVPDDFKGDIIEKEFNIKSNTTYGLNFKPDLEIVGASLQKIAKLNGVLGMTYNNYTGFGLSASISVGMDVGKTGMNAGLGISAGSESGLGISPSLSFSKKVGDETKSDTELGATIGLPMNSRAGLQELSISGNIKSSITKSRYNNRTKSSSSSKKDFKANVGTGISFASPSYSPQLGHDMLNVSASFQATLGSEIFAAHLEGSLGGSYSGQFLKRHEESIPAYGYMHSETGAKLSKVMLDFNREKDGSFNDHTPALPLTSFTYDVYSVSGQGIGGTYRPHRSDIGVVFDSEVVNTSVGLNPPGIEIGVANTSHPGINFSVTVSDSRSGKWTKDNSAAPLLAFKGNKVAQPLYEKFYFKQAGEKQAENDTDFFENMGSFSPVNVELDKRLFDVVALGKYNKSGTSMAASSRNRRVRRNESISIQTASEATTYGNAKEIEQYGRNNFGIVGGAQLYNRSLLDRVAGEKKGHHTSQITAYRADGAKYVYGIPAYNLKQVDRTFAIEGGSPSELTGLVNYAHGTDDKVSNKKGQDHYFDKSTMPGYAHSYLLTEILSVDYVDVTGNGPSDDDLGTYTKINYSKVDNYKWRTPYTKANYSGGMESRGDDDKASYIYGEKELWYIHSIVTKNFVAEFTLADRDDAYGVVSEAGGHGGGTASPSQKLTKITLYSKQDLEVNGRNAIPIKTVNFEYDYSLCQGVGNNKNGGGKLTLKKVFFTYGHSKKGKLSPYEFSYDGLNPSYNIKGYDRWGNYKPNTADNLTAENPYVTQTDVSDSYASAWHMTSVKLPSGGRIKIDYEADDYAFVQNRKAMQMVNIIGASADKPRTENFNFINNELYNRLIPRVDDLGNEHKIKARIPRLPKDYLVFEIDPRIADAINSKSDIGSAYFLNRNGQVMKHLKFRFSIDLGRHNEGIYEFVPGYLQILDYNVFTHGGVKYGWVKIKKDFLDDVIPDPLKANQISQAGWHFTRLYLPRLAYNQSDPESNGFVQIVESIFSVFNSIKDGIDGQFDSMRKDGMCRTFDDKKSYIRLFNPNNAKKGGGSRVSKVALSDSWSSITNNNLHQDAEYGQEYDYTTEENGKIISSGVAAYEPIIGGEENPFRQPVYNEVSGLKYLLAPSSDFHQEEPYGETMFPGPSVGYSKVTVKNLQYENVTRHATGKVVNEFYTARDFPTKTSRTDLIPVRKKTNPIFKLLKINVIDFMTASQGFAVELNDMHGKPKATWVYQEGKESEETFVSGVEYKYKTSKIEVPIPFNNHRKILLTGLDNNFKVLEKNGVISEKMVGVDYDFVTDMREQKTLTTTGGLGGNLDAFIVAVAPIVLPMVLPTFGLERVRFRSVVTTKVINRYGLLEETIAYDLGSRVSTKNILLDAETGEVLVTETVNQFDDPIYALNYPAHFTYDRMGLAYKNIDLQVPASAANDSYFVVGDEIAVMPLAFATFGAGPAGQKAWVETASSSGITAIDINGIPVSTSGKILKVLRSGRRNMQNTPVGNVTSLLSPIQGNTIVANNSINILNASAVEFTDEWGLFCECGLDPSTAVYNPYIMGTRGNWRAIKSHLFLTGRTQVREKNNPDNYEDNTNIREDGTYASFSPFWTIGGGTEYDPSDWNKNENSWQYTSEVTMYSAFGPELENQDALGRYSSAVYGYNNTLPIAVSANAQYREIAFDSFEDYDFDDCPDDHFSFEAPGNEQVVNTTSHSGRKSIKVGSGDQVGIIKSVRSKLITPYIKE